MWYILGEGYGTRGGAAGGSEITMKKICVVYRDRKNPEAIAWMDDCLKRVYEDYVEVEDCFMDEVPGDARLTADAFLVISRDLLPALRSHVPTMENVVTMVRSIRKEYLTPILEIPTGTEVLIVNDSLHTAEETMLMFYELGIGHLDMIPYDEAREPEGIYRKISWAITAGEPQAVPGYIEHVVDTRYREIGFDSMIRLIDILNLSNARVTYNLIRYISSIIEPMQGYRDSYFNSFLKDRMLNEYVYDSSAAIFALDMHEHMIYCNRHAQNLFGFDSVPSARAADCIPKELLELLRTPQDAVQQPLTIHGENFVVDKKAVLLGEEQLGVVATLQDELVLKRIETSFNKQLRDRGVYARYTFHDILHGSKRMDMCINMAKKAAMTEYTILIGGESGTGKELLAQAIHNYSQRKDMPFVAVNCAAITESLLESELFGYEEGAFTGARKKGKLGYFEQANRGTIFLDEIGDISPRLQQSLLRVLQERQIMKVGSNRAVDINVRIIAASNCDLLRAVREGRFRKDLYYRLNVVAITLPPLRERREDILLLFRSFMGKQDARLTNTERETILRYDWPGNVRELENCALYYKTFGELPQQVCGAGSGDGQEKREAEGLLLLLIQEGTSPTHGIGRTELMQGMRARDMRVSDAYLREMLHHLEEQGFISIGRGRQGTRLTEIGKVELEKWSIDKI